MIKVIFNLTRQIVLLVGTLLMLAALAAASLVECASTYLSTTFAFQLLNADSRPLKEDPLFGPLIGGLFAKLTFAETAAAVLTAAAVIGPFYIVHELGLFYDAIRDFRAIRRGRIAGDPEAYREAATKSAIKTIGVSLVLFVILAMSFNVFRFRSTAALNGAATREAAASLLNWANLSTQNDGFAMHLIGLGGYANIAITFLLAGLLALTVRKVGRRWELAGDAFSEAAGESLDRVPAPDADAEPATILPAQQDKLHSQGVPQAAPTDSPTAAAPKPEAGFTIRMPEPGPPIAPTSVDHADPAAREETLPVYGGDGESITVAAAQADPAHYWIDEATGSIWRRSFYDQLNMPDQAA